MTEPIYRVYVIELDDSLRKGTEKPAVYVGYSAKTRKSGSRSTFEGNGRRGTCVITVCGCGHVCTSHIRSRRADRRRKRWSNTWRTGSGVEGSRSTAVIDGRPDRQVVVG